jgi:hypothetical protein
MNQPEIPETSTYIRDGDYYRIKNQRVQTFYADREQWEDCSQAEDVKMWIAELTPISSANDQNPSTP